MKIKWLIEQCLDLYVIVGLIELSILFVLKKICSSVFVWDLQFKDILWPVDIDSRSLTAKSRFQKILAREKGWMLQLHHLKVRNWTQIKKFTWVSVFRLYTVLMKCTTTSVSWKNQAINTWTEINIFWYVISTENEACSNFD